jgi:ribonuclease T2
VIQLTFSRQWLSAAGITPSSSKTYTLSAIQAALKTKFGATPYIGCTSSTIGQIYYYHHVSGSAQAGTYTPTDSTDASNCPASGIKYPLKSGSAAPTTTISTSTTKTSTTTSGSSAPTGTGFSGKGFLEVSKGGCLISAGTWYTSGTCATFTAAASGAGFTLTSSKGACAIKSNEFVCASGNTATVFQASSGGLLEYAGKTAWYSPGTASGSTQETVYATSQSVSYTISWTATS